MRLGLLVPEGTLTKELPIILQKYSYISIEVIFYSSVFHVPSLLQGKQKHLDCLLFFGKTTMEYTASKITPTIPWEVIPRTKATLLMVLLKASLMGDNIYKLATDLHINKKKCFMIPIKKLTLIYLLYPLRMLRHLHLTKPLSNI